MAEKTIIPYTDVPFIPFEEVQEPNYEKMASMQIGFGSRVMRANEQGLWMGAEAFADAPFSVDMQGNVTASSITLSGYVATGGAAADINGNATTVSGGKLTAGSVTADKITVSQLSALSANLGTITAGTITGALFRTAASGERIEMDTTNTNQIRFYSSSTLYGMLEVDQVGSDGFIRLWSFDSGGGMEIDTGVGASGFNAVTLFSNGGEVFTNGNASNGYVGFTAKNGGSFYVHGGASGDEIVTDINWSCDIVPFANNSYNLGSSSLKWSTVYALTVSGLTTLSVSGTASVTNLNINSVAIPRIYHGYVSGTTLSKTNSSFTIANPATGRYTITHNFGSTNYVVLATALRATGSGAYSAKVNDLSSNSCEVTIFDDTGAAQASDFMFTIMRP